MRITPADAGKTTCTTPQHLRRFYHPRGCGENKLGQIYNHFFLGSPPRMRGKTTEKLAKSLIQRITPADAGKTSSARKYSATCRDHPRGCGENVKKKLLAPYTAGSPPRMRGKQALLRSQAMTQRITPADAGKTDFINASLGSD